MKESKNPYAIGFGIKPLKYIEQTEIIDEIIDEFNADYIQHPCFMLSGLRGSGKTVLMGTIGEKLKEDEDWIVIRLNPESDLLEDLAAKLYDTNKFIAQFINAEVNLSKYGIGISVKSVPPATSIESAVEKILKKIKKEQKRLLVEIDEVSNNDRVKVLAHAFQSFVSEGLPIFLLMTGLYKNIKDLKDDDTITFLYRAEERQMEPLNPTLIRNSYIKTLNIREELGWELAVLTKGYPVAYQVAGKYMWEAKEKEISEEFLAHFDAALARYVYKKIWSELSQKDRFFLSFICTKDIMPVNELLELTKQKKNEFTQYRERLIEKGVIEAVGYGKVSCTLPRFGEFVKRENPEVFG